MKRGRYTKKLLLLIPALSAGTLVVGCSDSMLQAMPTVYPTVTLEIQNYCPDTYVNSGQNEIFSYKDVFVYNANSYFNATEWVTDTDGDGLPDFFEQTAANVNQFGISYLFADTNLDGYSDLVKVNLGIPVASQVDMPTCWTTTTDTDADGLTDCEESIIGTTSTLSDTDGDGVPDGIEFRYGMNPTDANDANLNPSGDNIINYQKAKWGIPVATFMTTAAQQQMMDYSQVFQTSQNGATCTNPRTFSISNINILPLTAGNTLRVITLEDPQTPVIGGTHYARQSQILTVQVPSTVLTGSIVQIPDGIHGQIINNPTIVAPN